SRTTSWCTSSIWGCKGLERRVVARNPERDPPVRRRLSVPHHRDVLVGGAQVAEGTLQRLVVVEAGGARRGEDDVHGASAELRGEGAVAPPRGLGDQVGHLAAARDGFRLLRARA